MKASFFKNVKVSDRDSTLLIEQMQALENKVDEMNQSFYDIVNDLEGKYSIHEKEIELLEERLKQTSDMTKDINQLLNIQGKEIASIKAPEPEKGRSVYQPSQEDDVKIFQPSVRPKSDEAEVVKNEIIRLKALGYDEQAIARALGKGVREIKMLMSFIK